jgi:serine/threonine-protein kinase
MDWRKHVDIALAALDKGVFDLERFGQAIGEIREADSIGQPDLLCQAGLLTEDQLATLVALVEDQEPVTRPERSRPFVRAEDPGISAFPTAPLGLVANEAHTAPTIGPPGAPPGPATPTPARKSDLPSASDVVFGAPSAKPARRYVNVRALASGGVGTVAECLDHELGRRVAVKTLRSEFSSNPTAQRMLEREARVTGNLEHPSIIPVYDTGSIPGEGPYYVMRLVEQPTLEMVLSRVRKGEPDAVQTFTMGRLLRFFVQICQAVDYAHSRGVVHCDLKPGNILLGHFGEVLIVDWGLAYRAEKPTVYRGGTPSYMAPEQLDTTVNAIDARTDVFALGAILYELLCLAQAFPAQAGDTVVQVGVRMETPFPPPIRPRQRAPERHIAEEVEDICLRALELKPEHRFPSAHALANAMEAFLEGTKERERRQRRADEFAAQGAELALTYKEFQASRRERVDEVSQLRATVPAWESAGSKRALWDAEDRLAVMDALGIRTLQAAVSAYEQALEEVPRHDAARRGLARLYWAQMEHAQERRDELDRVYFEELVKQVDDGTFLEAMSSAGSVTLLCRPQATDVALWLLDDRDRRLVATREILLPAPPIERHPLPAGSYLAVLNAPGAPVTRVSFLIRAERDSRLVVDWTHTGPPEPGEIFVPGGVALLGGDESSPETQLRELDVSAFFIDEYPVSFAEYLEFLAETTQADPRTATAFVPQTRDGALYWRWDGQGHCPALISRWGDDTEDLLRLPAFGIDLSCAEAYAEWKSHRTGHAYRLPREEEWEKASRGADGRRYPWGDRFDASFCKMRQSRPGLAKPEPSGVFPSDESPYGVRDMAGGIADWVVPSGPEQRDENGVRQVVTRGGAWCDWPADCRLSARRPSLAIERSARIGFRLVRGAT